MSVMKSGRLLKKRKNA